MTSRDRILFLSLAFIVPPAVIADTGIIKGSIEGFIPSTVICRNRSQNESGQITNGTQYFDCGNDTGIATNIGDDVIITIRGKIAAIPADCKAILSSNPKAPSGLYFIDPDGSGPVTSFQTYCDMATNGGGYTLIQSHMSGQPSRQSDNIFLGSGSFLPLESVTALANVSTTLRISERSTSNYIESADAFPILRLRQGLNANDDSNKNSAHFIGTELSHLSYTCSGNSVYPGIYWACGNGGGAHIGPTPHGWSNDSLNIDVWLK